MAIGRTNAGGGGFNKSVIIVTAPTGSTVTCTKGTTVKNATEKNGEWWFKNLDTGEWTLKATLSGQTATQTVNVTQFDVYRVTMSYFKSTIKVTYPAGSTCTCSKDGEVLTAPNTSGSYTFTVTSAGTWTVKATDGDRTKSETVSITASGQSKSVTLTFELVLSESDFTKGWSVFGTFEDAGFTATKAKIDLTDYSTLTVDVTFGASGNWFAIYVTTSNSSASSIDANNVAKASAKHSSDSENIILDVSSIDGSYYIAMANGALYAATTTDTITGVKLS